MVRLLGGWCWWWEDSFALLFLSLSIHILCFPDLIHSSSLCALSCWYVGTRYPPL